MNAFFVHDKYGARFFRNGNHIMFRIPVLILSDQDTPMDGLISFLCRTRWMSESSLLTLSEIELFCDRVGSPHEKKS